MRVNYAGRENWNIVDVRSANPNFEVELNEPKRGRGQVTYVMTVRLKPERPWVSLATNLRSSPTTFAIKRFHCKWKDV